MRKYSKRMLALLLACIMILSCGITASARDADYMIDNIKVSCDGTLTFKVTKKANYNNESQYCMGLWYGYGFASALLDEIYFKSAKETTKTVSFAVKKGATYAVEGDAPCVSVKYTFTPAATALSSVKNTKSKAITVKWKKVSGVSGYQIQYSTKSNFSSKKTVTVKKASTVSTMIKNLKKGKKYYVRVRTYSIFEGKTCYSKWSAKKEVKITK